VGIVTPNDYDFSRWLKPPTSIDQRLERVAEFAKGMLKVNNRW
jgi:hypothetical protein